MKKISNRRMKKLLIKNGLDTKIVNDIMKNNGAFKDVFNSPIPDIEISSDKTIFKIEESGFEGKTLVTALP